MAEVNAEVKLLQDRVAALELENKSLREQEGHAAKAKIDNLTSASEAKATEISQQKTQIDALKEAVASVTKRAETAEANVKTLESDLATVKASETKVARLSSLVEKGASKEQASSLVEKFVNLDDAQFSEMANVLSAAFKKEKDEKDEDAEAEVEKKKKAEMEEEECKKKAAKASAQSAIDNAEKVNDHIPNASETSAQASETTRASVAEYLQENFLRYNSVKK